MNEIDFVLGVFLSSGAGYLLGKHYERKRARQAFRNFAKHAVDSTSRVNAVMIDMVRERFPDIDLRAFVKELLNKLRDAGIEAVAVNIENGKVEKADDNQDK